MKKSVVALGLMSALLLAGCSNGNASTSNNDNNTKSSSVAKKGKAVSYQDLTSNKKKNVKFNVTKDKDEDDNNADLSLTIKNNTNKDIKFNQAKFSLMADGDKKASSEKTGTIVVRAEHKGTIDELFEDVSTDVLNSTNLSIQYLNSDNVVAKPDLAEKQDSDDANQNTQANDQNQNNNSNNTSGATDTSSNADNSADNNANQASANRVVTSPDQAKSMMISATGGTGSLWTATDNGSGYTVTNDSGESGTISYSGDTTTPDGRFFSYQEYLDAPQH